jgi:hypothetical protein
MRGALFGDELSLPNASPTNGLWRSRIPIRSMHEEGVCLVKREFYPIKLPRQSGLFRARRGGAGSIPTTWRWSDVAGCEDLRDTDWMCCDPTCFCASGANQMEGFSVLLGSKLGCKHLPQIIRQKLRLGCMVATSTMRMMSAS